MLLFHRQLFNPDKLLWSITSINTATVYLSDASATIIISWHVSTLSVVEESVRILCSLYSLPFLVICLDINQHQNILNFSSENIKPTTLPCHKHPYRQHMKYLCELV